MKTINKDEVAKILTSKNALLPCHRCGGKSFSVIDGFSKLPIDKDLDQIQNIAIGGPTVPVVMVACNNCGAITMHAMGALGLMPKEEGNKNAQ
jgi:ribosomal protein L37E